jgi:hypothetical protein
MGRISHEIARRTSPDSCLSSTRPALIISNGNLPGLNGREFDAIFAEIAMIAGNSFAYHRYDVKSSFNFGLNPQCTRNSHSMTWHIRCHIIAA